MKQIGIICLLPEDVRIYHRELRQMIAEQFHLVGVANPLVPAHITVKYPFPVENPDEIEKAVEEFCVFQSKTRWVLQGFNYFQNTETPVIFIDVIPSEETRKVHGRFLERLRKISWVQWGPFDHADLHYHVTLGAQGLTSENFPSVWSFINQLGNPYFEASFDNLSLVQIDEDSRSVYKICRFQS